MKSTIAPSATASAPATSIAAAIDARDLVYAYAPARVSRRDRRAASTPQLATGSGKRALDGLSLAVPAGAIFGLLGPNGSGKSTLLATLIGRRLPESGSIRILGEPLTPALRSRVGIVFQEPSLDPNMTVRETMHLHGRMFGLPRAETARRSSLLLERVGLLDRETSLTPTLSGGMKRRLELARALLTSPEVLLLDEPTLALDPDSRLALWQHLLEANTEGRTLLLATNDVHEAERYCGEVALIDGGRVVAQGTPSDLKRNLRHDAVRVEWKLDAAAEATEIETWAGVGGVRLAGKTAHVTVDAASPFLARLFSEFGDRIHAVKIEESTLEDVYFQIVGKGITAARADDVTAGRADDVTAASADGDVANVDASTNEEPS